LPTAQNLAENQNAVENAGGSFENVFRKVRRHAQNRNAGRKPGGKAEALTPYGGEPQIDVGVSRV